jgi:hypothetical protein
MGLLTICIFDELSVQIFCSLLVDLFVLLLSFDGSVHKMVMNVVSDGQFTNIFSLSLACHFILFATLLRKQKF